MGTRNGELFFNRYRIGDDDKALSIVSGDGDGYIVNVI